MGIDSKRSNEGQSIEEESNGSEEGRKKRNEWKVAHENCMEKWNFILYIHLLPISEGLCAGGSMVSGRRTETHRAGKWETNQRRNFTESRTRGKIVTVPLPNQMK